MSLANELMRANHDTQLRTNYMTREMQRYQNAAAASASAVAAAKKEMHARRQDVDTMRSKLDVVMERLALGTEAASVLQANMNSGQDHAGNISNPGAESKDNLVVKIEQMYKVMICSSVVKPGATAWAVYHNLLVCQEHSILAIRVSTNPA